MNWKKGLLGAAAVVVLLAAFEVTRDKAPTTTVETVRLYPGLIDRVNDVRRLEVRTKDDHVVITGQGDAWRIETRDGFPARFERVKQALVQLAELEVLETKTSMPEKYGQIGVADLDTEGSTARQVTVAAEDGTPLVELLVGKERPGTGLTAPAHYVRRVGEETALLVEGELEIGARANDWLDNKVVDIAADRVSRVTVSPREGAQVVVAKGSRKDQFFDLQNVPEGQEPRSKALVSSLGGLLLGVAFDDVAKATVIAGRVPAATVEVQTFDGLVTTLERYDVEGKAYVKFDFAYNPDIVVTPAADEATADPGDAGEAKDAGGPGDEAEAADGESKDDAAGAAEAGAGDGAAQGQTATRDESAASDDTPDVAAEAAALGEKVAGWVYVLPDYKLRLIDRKLEDLIQPIKEKPAPAEATEP